LDAGKKRRFGGRLSYTGKRKGIISSLPKAGMAQKKEGIGERFFIAEEHSNIEYPVGGYERARPAIHKYPGGYDHTSRRAQVVWKITPGERRGARFMEYILIVGHQRGKDGRLGARKVGREVRGGNFLFWEYQNQ